MTSPASGPARDPANPWRPDEYAVLDNIQRRVLWLSTYIVHYANHMRPNPDKLKVGGHQASSASIVSILTALYFHHLGPGDRVSVKPHASPAYHAIQYLLGNLDQAYLPRLREFSGLQAYPSRTKDPDPVDFSTGSVGLGAVAPIFAAAAARYAHARFGRVTSRRFVAIVGDAELDEGNVWEAAVEEAVAGLDNVMMIVDLNRQSLDRIVPGARAAQLKELFAAAGWRVFEAKYGQKLHQVFQRPGGAALRRRIDEMSNEEYQSLLRRRGPELRARLTRPAGLDAPEDLDIAKALLGTPDETLHELLGSLGGHDLEELLRVFAEVDGTPARPPIGPAVVFAYTIKGWGLPFAADAHNHSMLLGAAQIAALARDLGIAEGAEWNAFPPDSPEGRWCRAAAARLCASSGEPEPLVAADTIPASLGLSFPATLSSQEALGRILPQLTDIPVLGARVVTAAPDVSISTHLSNWVGKVGVFAPQERQDYQEDTRRVLRWRPGPTGQHIELGISEMNLFLLLSQLGLSYEISGQQLFPIGTVYDPFVCRGLDALIYALYNGSKIIFAGTPSGVSLSPEGGAHQSTVTASLGIELPNLDYYEPAFAPEVEWILLAALRACCDRVGGRSTYLRLSTKPIDQHLMVAPLKRLGEAELRRQVLAGGYRLLEGLDVLPNAAATQRVQIITSGAMAPEAVEAAARLAQEEIAASVIHVTSPGRLFSVFREARSRRRHDAHDVSLTARLGHLSTLLPWQERHIPIVTLQDASAHSLAFLGSVYGTPTVPLGVDEFGQSGSSGDVYRQAGIGIDDIIAASYLAMELGQEG